MNGEHWTAEEYRRYLETGKKPDDELVKVLKFTPENAGNEMEKCRATMHVADEIDRWPKTVTKDELAALQKPSGKRRKYGNEPQYIGWKKFDSKKEAEFYQQLMLRVKAGELWFVIRQVPFDLAEKERLQYFADFVAVKPDGTLEAVYDVKSEATRKSEKYIIKKKLMREIWGISITEV